MPNFSLLIAETPVLLIVVFLFNIFIKRGSENSVTTSDESEMTDLAGLFVESEIEAPEVVRAKKSLFTIISRLLFLVGQEFKNMIASNIWISNNDLD